MQPLPTDDGTDRLTACLDAVYHRTLEDFPAMRFFPNHVLVIIRNMALSMATNYGRSLDEKLSGVEALFGPDNITMVITGIVIQIELKSGPAEARPQAIRR